MIAATSLALKAAMLRAYHSSISLRTGFDLSRSKDLPALTFILYSPGAIWDRPVCGLAAQAVEMLTAKRHTTKRQKLFITSLRSVLNHKAVTDSSRDLDRLAIYHCRLEARFISGVL